MIRLTSMASMGRQEVGKADVKCATHDKHGEVRGTELDRLGVFVNGHRFVEVIPAVTSSASLTTMLTVSLYGTCDGCDERHAMESNTLPKEKRAERCDT